MNAYETALKKVRKREEQFRNAKSDDKFKIGVRLDMRSSEDNDEEGEIPLAGNRKIRTAQYKPYRKASV